MSDTVHAFLLALVIFFATIFLFVRQWIGFSMVILLLFFAIAAGAIASHYHIIQGYIEDYRQNRLEESSQSAFKKQITQALEDVKIEVTAEKENLHQLMQKLDQLYDQMNIQKVKLQQFIDKTKEHFQIEESQPESVPESVSGEHPDHRF